MIENIFDVDKAYWVGMGVLSAATLAYILVCWLIPPKKNKGTGAKAEE